jgi:hypothetical protein
MEPSAFYRNRLAILLVIILTTTTKLHFDTPALIPCIGPFFTISFNSIS